MSEEKWIFESPDGKTVFRRPFGNYDPSKKEEVDMSNNLPTGRLFTDWPFDVKNKDNDWICSVCGKDSSKVEYDYIGSGTNHLQCDLELEDESCGTQRLISKPNKENK